MSSLNLDVLSPQDWAKISESVHKFSFGTERTPDFDRISYALLVRKDEELAAYSTIIELDKDSCYMQHGGNFPEVKGGPLTLRSYLMMVNYIREKYKFVSTRIWNRNRAMLKLAWAAGFVITGCEVNRSGDLYLVLDLEQKICAP